MGAIQSSINQILGIAALGSQLPGGQKIAEATKLRQQNKALEKAKSALQAEGGQSAEKAGVAGEIAREQVEVARKRFYNNPSKKNTMAYLYGRGGFVEDAVGDVAPQAAEPTSPQAVAAQTAETSSANAVAAKKAQKRSFLDYIKDMPTSLGGTVGELDPKIQKQIMQQIPQNERRRMMNEADRRKNDGE